MKLQNTTKVNIHTIINLRAIHKKHIPGWDIKNEYGHLLRPEWRLFLTWYKSILKS